MEKQKKGAEKVTFWNEHYPPGTEVIQTDDFGVQHLRTTRSEAWTLGHGEPVVKVSGIVGCYLMSRLNPDPKAVAALKADPWTRIRSKNVGIVGDALRITARLLRKLSIDPKQPHFDELYDLYQDLKAETEMLRRGLFDLANDPDEQKLVER